MSQRPKCGEVQPLSREAARCYPHHPDHACYGCARHRFGEPDEAEVRREPIIDASLFRLGDGRCQMVAPLPAVAVVDLSKLSVLERALRAAA